MVRTKLFAALVVLTTSATVFADPLEGLATPSRSVARATPREAMQSYLEACREGRWADAAHVLDLRRLPAPRRAEVGPIRARRLKAVLDQELWVELEALPDVEDGALEAGARRVEVGVVTLDAERVPIALHRVRLDDGARVWLLAPDTVAAVPELFAALGPSFVESLPEIFSTWRLGEILLWQWLGLALFALLALVLGVLVARIVLRVSERLTDRTRARWDDHFVRTLRGPTRIVVALIAFLASLEALHLAAPAYASVRRLVLLGFIATLGWLATRVVRFVGRVVLDRAVDREGVDREGPKARAVRTQVAVLQRIVNIVLGVLTVSLMLLQFEVVRSVGMSLLASAGIAGVVLGLAAQKSIAGLLAGFQLSITQPLRIGDVVILDGEWGTIEQINLTYVVVKIWDERRLVVPIATILEKPFQNWTRSSTQLLGTVFFWADHTLPVDEARKELDAILEDHPLWDGRVKNVVVTEVTERAIQVRALVSARNASEHWDLRCDVRERLVAWLRDFEGGRHLPRVRLEREGRQSLG